MATKRPPLSNRDAKLVELMNYGTTADKVGSMFGVTLDRAKDLMIRAADASGQILCFFDEDGAPVFFV